MTYRPGETDPCVDLLPPPRGEHGYRIAIVCLGNICRSPMAEVVLTERLRQHGLDDSVEVVSAGTGDWHIGEPMDRRAAAILTASGYDPSDHRAKQFEPGWLTDYDLVLVMDERNLTDVSRMSPGGSVTRLRMFRDFDPSAAPTDRDVPDPWYGKDDGFDAVLTMVERTAASLISHLQSRLARP